MAGESALLELGPCQVLFGIAGAEPDMGRTQGGVRVRFLTDYADLMTDQTGTRPVDMVITGQGAEIEVPLAEITLQNLATALHQTYFAVGGAHLVVGEKRIGTRIADSFSNSLLLKKYVNGIPSASADDWVRFPKACPSAETLELVFNGSDQRTIPAVFIAFFDDSDVLYYMGDEAVGWS